MVIPPRSRSWTQPGLGSEENSRRSGVLIHRESAQWFDVLASELHAWALQREKVLVKLDVRGSRRARALARRAKAASASIRLGEDVVPRRSAEEMQGIRSSAARLLSDEDGGGEPQVGSAQPSLQVLLVGDDELYLSVLRLALERGTHVEAARSGGELVLGAEARPDAILFDADAIGPALAILLDTAAGIAPGAWRAIIASMVTPQMDELVQRRLAARLLPAVEGRDDLLEVVQRRSRSRVARHRALGWR